MSLFVERFKSLLNREKISLRALGREIDVSSSQLSKYSRGNFEPSLENAIKICEFFKCSLDFLFGLDYAPNRFGKFKNANFDVFAKRLKNLIELNNTNINQMAKKNLISRSGIYSFLSAKNFPTISIISVFAKTLKTSIEYLIGRTDIDGD